MYRPAVTRSLQLEVTGFMTSRTFGVSREERWVVLVSFTKTGGTLNLGPKVSILVFPFKRRPSKSLSSVSIRLFPFTQSIVLVSHKFSFEVCVTSPLMVLSTRLEGLLISYKPKGNF